MQAYKRLPMPTHGYSPADKTVDTAFGRDPGTVARGVCVLFGFFKRIGESGYLFGRF